MLQICVFRYISVITWNFASLAGYIRACPSCHILIHWELYELSADHSFCYSTAGVDSRWFISKIRFLRNNEMYEQISSMDMAQYIVVSELWILNFCSSIKVFDWRSCRSYSSDACSLRAGHIKKLVIATWLIPIVKGSFCVAKFRSPCLPAGSCSFKRGRPVK